MLSQPQQQTRPSLLTPELKDHLTPESLERIEQAYDHAQATGTRELYRKQWYYFQTWCVENDLCPKPAAPGTVAAYMTERAAQVTVATLQTAQAAIRSYHEEDDLISPTKHPNVRRVMRGLAREYPRASQQVAGIDYETFDFIIAAAHLPKDHETQEKANRRAAFDIALISVMRDAMLRRSEAAKAEWRHVQRTPEGTFILEIPTSKTDPTGEGAFLFLSLRTIQALADMLKHRGGNSPEPGDRIFRIGERQIANRIKEAAKHAGVDARFSGHSARVGMALDLAIDGVELPALMQAGRWSSQGAAARYIKNIQARKNAVASWHQQHHTDAEIHAE